MRKLFIHGALSLLALIIPSVSFALTSSDFTRFTATNVSDRLGRSVIGADLNGDGYDELISGAPNNATGYISITYGSSTLPSAATISTSNSVVITGNGTTDFFGVSLAKGDVNADGYDDVVVSATGDTTGGGANSGAIYLIYGQSSQLTSGAVSSMSNRARFYAGPSVLAGSAIAMGDINNDGFDDIIVGTSNDASTGGAVYIIYGQAANYSGLSNTVGSLAKFTGEAAGNSFGGSIAVGDANGDGYDDFLVGASLNNDGGTAAGSVYLFYGQSTQYTGTTAASSVAELTGEAMADNFGATMTAGDITGDSLVDFIVTASGNDDGANGAGAVYVIPGSTTTITSGTGSASIYSEYTGVTTNDAIGQVATADMNGDGVAEMIIGGQSVSTGSGAVYIVAGGTTSGSLSTVSLATITGSGAESFGRAVGSGDLNGDGYVELLVGANSYSSNTGAAYYGLMLLDSDLDGTIGSGLYTSIDSSLDTDCNDSDASVATEQTYYVDEDGDDLGTTEAGTPVCAGTAPDGYADNTNDPDDTVVNNATYVSEDPSDASAAEDYITAVEGGTRGRIKVSYADDTEYTYTIFSTSSTKKTLVQQYPNSGYGVVVDRKGKKIKLVNLYTGEIAASKQLSKKAVDSANFVLKDLRTDHKTEAVVTLLRNSKASVYVVKVTKSSGKLKVKDHASVTSDAVATNKTKVKKSMITLRNSQRATVAEYKVNKQYQLIAQ